MEGQLKEKTVLQTAENTPQPQSEYDEVRAMLHGLLNDHDGSFARKVLAENQDKVAAFEAKVQQEQDRWQLAQELENSADKINFGGRSFG
ncbi:MAG: hypothetical protein Q4D78_04320 [Neisseria zoodegmatis]|uniref:hypothetical protein n=1 Tax=Neisseria zoodegmatis TaxID=326523 RepID=UPI0026EA550E|nr:hypothetical protein [Neisseria zoodegmatis]MDO5069412.1 hypothetical protein [Neisseria zoodegmatis]